VYCSTQDVALENVEGSVLGSGMLGVCSSSEVTFAHPVYKTVVPTSKRTKCNKNQAANNVQGNNSRAM